MVNRRQVDVVAAVGIEKYARVEATPGVCSIDGGALLHGGSLGRIRFPEMIGIFHMHDRASLTSRAQQGQLHRQRTNVVAIVEVSVVAQGETLADGRCSWSGDRARLRET